MKKTSRSCGCHSHNGLLLSPEGLAQREPEFADDPGVGLPRSDYRSILDKVGSVSGARRDEMMLEFDDELIDEQYRRFLKEVAL